VIGFYAPPGCAAPLRYWESEVLAYEPPDTRVVALQAGSHDRLWIHLWSGWLAARMGNGDMTAMVRTGPGISPETAGFELYWTWLPQA
jgi:hypothetical protein